MIRPPALLAVCLLLSGCDLIESVFMPEQHPDPEVAAKGRWSLFNGTDTDGVASTYMLDTATGTVYRLGKLKAKDGTIESDIWWEMDRFDDVEEFSGRQIQKVKPAPKAEPAPLSAEDRKELEDLGVDLTGR